MGTSGANLHEETPAGRLPVREELRLAVVMNGGVSLAVWIGGVVTELERFRQSDPRAGLAAESTWTGVRRSLGIERVLIDVLAGSSAGGLNAVFLALAQAFEKVRLDELRDVWFDLADFDTDLLRRADDPRPVTPLDGDYFLRQLRARIASMIDEKQPSSHAVDLRVTATSLRGRPEDFPDLIDGHFVNSNHEVSFRFRNDPSGRDRDFAHPEHRAQLVENLALAGRASASFPVAFDPVALDPTQFEDDRPGHVIGIDVLRFVVDGGVLNNLPVDRAVEAIFYQPADEPVNRVLLAVIPLHRERADDDHLSRPEDPDHPYSTFAVGVASGITIPRTESSAVGLHELERLNRDSTLLATARTALLDLSFDGLSATGAGLWPVYVRQQMALAQPRDEPLAVDSPAWLPADPWEPGSRRSGAAVRRAAAIVLDVLTRVTEHFTGPQPNLPALRRTVHACIARTALLDPYDPQDPQLAATRGWIYEVLPGGGREGQDHDIGHDLGLVFDDLAAVVAAVAPVASTIDGLGSLDFAGGPEPGTSHRWLTSIEVSQGALGPAVNPQSMVHPAIISPARPAPIDPLQRTHPDLKLAGDELGHFGAFLKRSWRANDWMWGRLDAASTLGAVCGRFHLTEREVDRLVTAAQAEIVREEAPAVVMAVVHDIERGAKTPKGRALIAGDRRDVSFDRLRDGVTWDVLVDELHLGSDPEREFLRRLELGRETVREEFPGSLLVRVGTRFVAVMTKVALNAQFPTLIRRVLSVVLVPMRYVTELAARIVHRFSHRR